MIPVLNKAFESRMTITGILRNGLFFCSAVFTWTNLLVVVAELDGGENEALDLVPLVTNAVLEVSIASIWRAGFMCAQKLAYHKVYFGASAVSESLQTFFFISYQFC
jgi:hypothetical protein